MRPAALAATALVGLAAAATRPGLDSFLAFARAAAQQGLPSLAGKNQPAGLRPLSPFGRLDLAWRCRRSPSTRCRHDTHHAALASASDYRVQVALRGRQLEVHNLLVGSVASWRGTCYLGALGSWVELAQRWAAARRRPTSAQEMLLACISAGPLLWLLASTASGTLRRFQSGAGAALSAPVRAALVAARWTGLLLYHAFRCPPAALPHALLNLMLVLLVAPHLDGRGTGAVLATYAAAAALARAAARAQAWRGRGFGRALLPWETHGAAQAAMRDAGVYALCLLEWQLEGGWRRWPWAGRSTSPAVLLAAKAVWDVCWSHAEGRPLPLAAPLAGALAAECAAQLLAGGGMLQMVAERLVWERASARAA